MSKIETEQRTVQYMIALYCRKNHGGKPLCDECIQLNDYARNRLDKCQFGNAKPACKHCSVHCYNKQMRDKIRQVMRYSGPRMLLYYPIDYFKHMFNKQATQ